MASSTLAKCLSEGATSTALIAPGANTPPVIFSHQQLHHHVHTVQEKLARLGIRPTDTVALALPNGVEFIVSFLAITMQRARCAPLNADFKEDEFEYYLRDLGACLVLVPAGSLMHRVPVVEAARRHNIAIAEIEFDWIEFTFDGIERALLEGRMEAPLHTPQDEDIALVLHTSGTTGRPKTVPLTHANLCRTLVNVKDTYNLGPADRTMLVMPLFHVHGLLAGLLTPLFSRGSVIIPPRFSAKDFWSDFSKFNANWYTAVPTIHQILLRYDLPKPMPAIRFVRSCSSPLPPSVHNELEKSLNAPVLEAYAMTEAAHQMTSNPLPPNFRKPGSVGRPQGVKIKIVDNNGSSLATGKTGEVCVNGSNVMQQYLNVTPDIAAKAFTQGGYFRTGDQGYLDRDGYLFLTGRLKELINKGGEKISPVEIDNLILQHPAVQEAVTFAIDDSLYGENVAVAIVLEDGCELLAEDLAAWCAKRVANFKVPKKIYITEVMPKTATGKVQRHAVSQAMRELEARAQVDNVQAFRTRSYKILSENSSQSEEKAGVHDQEQRRQRPSLLSMVRSLFCIGGGKLGHSRG